MAVDFAFQFIKRIYWLFDEQPERLQQLVEIHGIPDEQSPEHVRINLEKVLQIYESICEDEEHKDLGNILGHDHNLGALGVLGYFLASCGTLRESLLELQHYHPLICRGWINLQFQELDKHFQITLVGPIETEGAKLQLLIHYLFAVIKTIQTVCDEDCLPKIVMTQSELIEKLKPISEQWEYKVTNKSHITLAYPKRWLGKPLIGANKRLKTILKEDLELAWRQLNEQVDVIDRVLQTLHTASSLQEVSLAAIAEQMHVSDRTLNRQLSERKTSFRDILTNFKNHKAIHMLLNQKDIHEITHYLGFSERSAFERAFKSWFGITPVQFRQEYMNSQGDEKATSAKALLGEFPSLPTIATQILKLMSQGPFEIEDLSDIIKRDPILAAKLVGMANSALYGQFKCETLDQAIINVIGLATVKNLAIAIVANGVFQLPPVNGFTMEKYWMHALATASLTQQLAKRSKQDYALSPDDFYLAGLISNIGQLCLIKQMASIIGEMFVENQSLTLQEHWHAEKKLLGLNECVAGAALANQWQMPKDIAECIGYMGRDNPPEQIQSASQLLRSVNALCRRAIQKKDFEAELDTLEKACGLNKKSLEYAEDWLGDQLENLKTTASLIING